MMKLVLCHFIPDHFIPGTISFPEYIGYFVVTHNG